mgnify:CR=1 FL=1
MACAFPDYDAYVNWCRSVLGDELFEVIHCKKGGQDEVES